MNNLFMLLQSIRNPEQFIRNMAGNNQVMQNPMMRNAIEMLQRGDRSGLDTLVDNVARQRGTSLEEIRRTLGI